MAAVRALIFLCLLGLIGYGDASTFRRDSRCFCSWSIICSSSRFAYAQVFPFFAIEKDVAADLPDVCCEFIVHVPLCRLRAGLISYSQSTPTHPPRT